MSRISKIRSQSVTGTKQQKKLITYINRFVTPLKRYIKQKEDYEKLNLIKETIITQNQVYFLVSTMYATLVLWDTENGSYEHIIKGNQQETLTQAKEFIKNVNINQTQTN